MSTTNFLDSLDYEQLKFFRDECEARIRAIKEEEKKVAWAVTDGGINFGWFRTEDYPKAIECLAAAAAERWADADKGNPGTRYELNIAIEGERLPLSEYNALFADGQWG
ncbi:hypothetical protein F3240_17240 [Salmonella enterica]|nr:hypothetical protein [Salmonella enterica]ECW8338341.1 hypothetical protein [Salmonella enterica]ECW8355737.1 hypothetical protein [Salmonella enterica]EEF8538358.1 hypothetical protein [Salmonella enterica]